MLAHGGVEDLALTQPVEVQPGGEPATGGGEAQAGQRGREAADEGRERRSIPARQGAGGGGPGGGQARQAVDDLDLAQRVAGCERGELTARGRGRRAC